MNTPTKNFIKTFLKILAALALVVVLAFCLMVACMAIFDDGEEADSQETTEVSENVSGQLSDAVSGAQSLGAAAASGSELSDAAAGAMAQGDEAGTWTICWYLCGSDLESGYGAASTDLYEMMEAELSDDVQVIIQTGGAYEWMLDIDPDVIQRYCLNADDIELVDERPLQDMGDEDTLAEFLEFCKKNYPADHTAVIFWNHGGGTVGGVAYDELFDYDSLSLTEIHNAFERVYDLSEDDPPIDLIGFDACLMASIDTAAMAKDIARVLVASEETEPDVGWEYTCFLSGLSEDTGMGAAALGQLICDCFMDGCAYEGVEDEVTLSAIDLQKIPALIDAYNGAGVEALTALSANSRYYTEFSRCADSSENYGGNNYMSGYTDMVDLGDLVRNSSGLLPESASDVLSALDDCVLYQVTGAYRKNASGLSCYHSYDGDYDMYRAYSEAAASRAFDYFYYYGLTGDWSDEVAGYLAEASAASGSMETPTEPITHVQPQSGTLPGESSAKDLEDHAVYLDEDNNAVLDLGAELAADLSTVLVHLAYVDDEDDIILDLGTDTDLNGDWETGVFSDNFWGTWGSIDGNLCYREVVYEGDDYTLYSVPIMLNGKECTLSVVYNYTDEKYEILGARPVTEETAMGSKYLLKLNPGDKITTLHSAASISGDDDFEFVEIDTFTVTEDTSFYDVDMGEGDFVLFFVMMDAQNNSYYSAPVYYTVDSGGEIYVEVD